MHPVALASVRVWDGVAERTSGPLHLRIEGGRVAAIGADPALLDGARVLETPADAVALPGLIDAHVHLTLDPGVSSPAEQLKLPHEQVRQAMAERALAMVRAGITTARDLGGGAWLEIELRDRIVCGEISGPRLLCAGQPLTVESGHCHFWGGVVASDDDIRETVRRQVEHGADCIKVMATGGVMTRGSGILRAQFDQRELELVGSEAARHGRRVAAHCHGTAGIRNAVAARLRTIEHCSFAGEKGFGSDLDPDPCRALGRQDTWVSPTVNANWTRFLAGKDGEPGRFFADMRAVFAELRAAGARLIASTDAGIPGVRHDRLPQALPVLARFADLSPVDALRAATSEPARALELDAETGRLAPGLAADVLVVRGDPLEDLERLAEPALVLARGVAVPAA